MKPAPILTKELSWIQYRRDQLLILLSNLVHKDGDFYTTEDVNLLSFDELMEKLLLDPKTEHERLCLAAKKIFPELGKLVPDFDYDHETIADHAPFHFSKGKFFQLLDFLAKSKYQLKVPTLEDLCNEPLLKVRILFWQDKIRQAKHQRRQAEQSKPLLLSAALQGTTKGNKEAGDQAASASNNFQGTDTVTALQGAATAAMDHIRVYYPVNSK